MPEAGAGDFILFPSGGAGSSIGSAAALAASAPGVTLLRRTPSGLLVHGTRDAVQRLAASLPGWEAEPNRRVRAGV